MKRYKHPNPKFFDVSMTEDGRWQIYVGGRWKDVEYPVSVPVGGRRSVARGRENKLLHRFAYECFVGKELPLKGSRVVFKNYWRNDLSKNNLTLSCDWKEYSNKALNGWASRMEDGTWTLCIGFQKSPDETISGFSSEQEAREKFQRLIKRRGKRWLLGGTSKKAEKSLPVQEEILFKEEDEEEEFDAEEAVHFAKERSKFTLTAKDVAKYLGQNYKTFMRNIKNDIGPKYVFYMNRRMWREVELADYLNLSEEQQHTPDPNIEMTWNSLLGKRSRLQKESLIAPEGVSKENLQEIKKQLIKSQLEIERVDVRGGQVFNSLSFLVKRVDAIEKTLESIQKELAKS